MKNFSSWFTLASLIVLALSCTPGQDEDDKMSPPEPIQGFVINDQSYNTPHAYLVFNTAPQYDPQLMRDVYKIKNQFSFLFLDGQAVVKDRNLYYSTDSRHSSYHHFRDFGSAELYDRIDSVQIEVGTYIQSPSTTTRIGIANLSPDITIDGIAYGRPTLAGTNYLLTNEDEATFHIHDFTIDYSTRGGTIDCEYSIAPSWEGPIIGRYVGSFEILVD